MLDLITSTIKTNDFKQDIKELISYLAGEKSKISKNNFFYINKKVTKKEYSLEALNLYNRAKNFGGKYFLLYNIENIYYLYSELLNLNLYKNLVAKILKENLYSYKTYRKINVFKDVSKIKKHLKEYVEEINFTKTDLLDELFQFNTNFTTLDIRNTYDKKEAIIRIKKDYQKEIINYIHNNKKYSFIGFLHHFGSVVLKQYLKDYIYYLYFYKKMKDIEIVLEINSFLLQIEQSFIEDYYILLGVDKDETGEEIKFLLNSFLINLKKGINSDPINLIFMDGEPEDATYNENIVNKLFEYRIYFN